MPIFAGSLSRGAKKRRGGKLSPLVEIAFYLPY